DAISTSIEAKTLGKSRIPITLTTSICDVKRLSGSPDEWGRTPAYVSSSGGQESSIGERGHSVVECGPEGFWRTERRHGRGRTMDGATAILKERLDQLLREAAEVSVALDRAEGTIVGIPHYSVIEARAHELGRELSRRIQARQMGQFAAHAAD